MIIQGNLEVIYEIEDESQEEAAASLNRLIDSIINLPLKNKQLGSFIDVTGIEWHVKQKGV